MGSTIGGLLYAIFGYQGPFVFWIAVLLIMIILVGIFVKTLAEYQKEYEQFVASMSYAAEDELVSFEEAVVALGRIIAVYNDFGA